MKYLSVFTTRISEEIDCINPNRLHITETDILHPDWWLVGWCLVFYFWITVFSVLNNATSCVSISLTFDAFFIPLASKSFTTTLKILAPL
jgi:hypothetical protein